MVSSQPAHGHVEGVDVLATSAPGDLRRRTNVGRKAEATDQFRPPRCGLCVMKLCAPGPPSSASRSCQTLPDGVSPNTEGGQTADGRWNPPTNFGHLIGDLLGMRNLARVAFASRRRPRPGAGPRPTSRCEVKIARRAAHPISEGGPATVGRWSGDGRKVVRRRSEGGTHRKISGTSLEIYWI
jgi:hypothetical protein